MVRLIQPFLLIFAKKNEKTHTKRQLFLYNKVVFEKNVPLYKNVRLETNGYCSTKNQPIGKNILELPRSVKKAWSPVEALLGSSLLK